MNSKDYYTLLSVDRSASAEEIRKAYIRISRIVHPDRFDPKTQEEDWRHANQLLSRINEAYAVLKDPDKRAAYDRSIGFNSYKTSAAGSGGYSYSSSGTQQSYTSRPDPGPDPRKDLTAGHAPFNKLPEQVRNNLRKREKGELREHYYVETERATEHYLKAGAILLWIWFLSFSAFGTEWTLLKTLFYFSINTACFYFFARHLLWLIKWHKAELSSSLYITPLYVIETHHGMVHWWPVTGIQNIRITNGKGYYSSQTMLNLHYKDGVARFSLGGIQLARNCVQAVYNFQNKANSALNNLAYDYIRSKNEFKEAFSIAPQSDKKLQYWTFGTPMLAGLLLFVGLYQTNLGNEPYIGNRLISQMLPHNGARIAYVKHDGLAPLELKASSNYHFLVRITNVETHMPVYTVFVRAGSRLHLKMPTGRFNIRYTGGRTWYGPEAHFGDDSVYFRDQKTYEFSTENQELRGNFVTLADESRLRSGDIVPIPPNAF